MPNKGFKQSEEHKRKLSLIRKGKKHSQETKMQMSKSHIGYKQSEEHIQKVREANLGKKRSQDTKRKLSEAHKGKPSSFKGKTLSQEAKDKISQSLRGKKPSKETLQKRSNTMRDVYKPSAKRGYGKKGSYNGIPYDSSYELKFMKFLDEYKIPYKRADNKQFRVKYIFEDNEHYYYPDFYLPRENLIVELKPYFKLKDLKTKTKLEAGKQQYGENFIVLTEKELPELL